MYILIGCDNRICATCITSATNCTKNCNENCALCATDGTCLSCPLGFYLSLQQCIKCPLKCFHCEKNPDTSEIECLSCNPQAKGRSPLV